MVALVLALALGQPVALTAADNGRIVPVRAGAAIELRLATNPSTGYQWRFAAKPAVRIVRLRWTKLVEPPSGRVGAPATRVWRFVAVRRGSTRLKLVYVRPWRPTEAAKTFTVRFNVLRSS